MASTRQDVLEQVTAAIIESLERGVMPWRKPWVEGSDGSGNPHNALSGKPYAGVNWVWLTMKGMQYASQGWLTFKQARELGGSVRKGEKGTQVIFWKPGTREETDDTGAKVVKSTLLMREYTVFNLDQCDNVTLPKRRNAPKLRVVNGDAMGPVRDLVNRLALASNVKHGGDKACYVPSVDIIAMPEPAQFASDAHYRATLAHECVHATGAKHRLDRIFGQRFGDNAYAAEELVAELGSAMIGATLGFDASLLEHHASYLATWLRVLKDDKKAILTASSKAAAACKYLVNEQTETVSEEPVLALAA